MRILVLGAGQVGKTVASAMLSEKNDITMVDLDIHLLKFLEIRMDIRTVQGNASHPDVLIRAGAEDADLILAVTNSDETNMLACQVAYTLFQTPIRLARVRSPSYQQHPELFSTSSIPVDFIINPELILVHLIENLVDYSEALQILDFADGTVKLVAVRAHSGGPLVGNELRTLSQQVSGDLTRIVAIYRRNRAIIANGKTIIEQDDEVFFLSESKHVPAVLGRLRPIRPAGPAGYHRRGWKYRLPAGQEHRIEIPR